VGDWSISKLTLFSEQSSSKQAIPSQAKTDMRDNEGCLKIFPNPANNVINFYTKAMKDKTEVQILNSKGEQVKKLQFLPGESNQINISDIASGVYILQLNDGLKTQSAKFIKL
jgi:hypothetical protein